MMIPQDQLDQRFGVSVEIRGNNNKLIISPVETGCQNGFFFFFYFFVFLLGRCDQLFATPLSFLGATMLRWVSASTAE